MQHSYLVPCSVPHRRCLHLFIVVFLVIRVPIFLIACYVCSSCSSCTRPQRILHTQNSMVNLGVPVHLIVAPRYITRTRTHKRNFIRGGGGGTHHKEVRIRTATRNVGLSWLNWTLSKDNKCFDESLQPRPWSNLQASLAKLFAPEVLTYI